MSLSIWLVNYCTAAVSYVAEFENVGHRQGPPDQGADQLGFLGMCTARCEATAGK
jgi:hypothetical protein